MTGSTNTTPSPEPQRARNSRFAIRYQQPVPSFRPQRWPRANSVLFQEDFYHPQFHNPEPLATGPLYTCDAPQASAANFEDSHPQYHQQVQSSTDPQVPTTTVQERAYAPPPLPTHRPDDYQYQIRDQRPFQERVVIDIHRPRPPSPRHNGRESQWRDHSPTRSRSRSISQNRGFIYASPRAPRQDLGRPLHPPIAHDQEQAHPRPEGHQSYGDPNPARYHSTVQNMTSLVNQGPGFPQVSSRPQPSQVTEDSRPTTFHEAHMHPHPSRSRRSSIIETSLAHDSPRSQPSMANAQVDPPSGSNRERDHNSYHGSRHSKLTSKSRDPDSRSGGNPRRSSRLPVIERPDHPPISIKNQRGRHGKPGKEPSSRSSSAAHDSGFEGSISDQTSGVIDSGASTRSQKSSATSYRTHRESIVEPASDQTWRVRSYRTHRESSVEAASGRMRSARGEYHAVRGERSNPTGVRHQRVIARNRGSIGAGYE